MEAAAIKEELADIINAVIEKLIKERVELPDFYEIHRIAQSGRSAANNQLYDKLCAFLDVPSKELIKTIDSLTMTTFALNPAFSAARTNRSGVRRPSTSGKPAIRASAENGL